MDPKNPNPHQVPNFLIPPPQPRDASDDNKQVNDFQIVVASDKEPNNSVSNQGGSLTAGLMISHHDLDCGGGSSSGRPGWGEGGGEMLGLELGLSQEGNVGVLNQQIYQQMAQAQGRVLHHTLHHNPGHEDHQQESCGRDESQGS
ncbi:hypothetical protein Bca52824_061380 [Brassica carinata]|uniref:Uncharacterized protein n=1 Tax=Brassica carinata TaxID=52824 RepID=A0A8X7QYD0_BRACI|nr:hypothetical protein Bca52824_061380 [Brassica carinata]